MLFPFEKIYILACLKLALAQIYIRNNVSNPTQNGSQEFPFENFSIAFKNQPFFDSIITFILEESEYSYYFIENNPINKTIVIKSFG